MKPVFQKLACAFDEGLVFKVIRGKSFDCPWHFHSEYELILVLQSGGYRLIGDNLAPLRPGDMVFVGPNLPHIYRNDEDVPAQKAPPVHAMLIQFEPEFLGEGLLRLPVLGSIRRLLQRSAMGLHITGATRTRVAALMAEMVSLRGVRRIIHFLTILDTLAGSRECRPLASPGFTAGGSTFDQDRMDRVVQFIHANLDQPICLPELAKLVSLSQGAFSRFFKAHAGKTLPHFVNELRIGRACRLLAETEMNVTEIAYACGFGNLSNFNRQFHRLKKSTPRRFRAAVAARALRS